MEDAPTEDQLVHVNKLLDVTGIAVRLVYNIPQPR